MQQTKAMKNTFSWAKAVTVMFVSLVIGALVAFYLFSLNTRQILQPFLGEAQTKNLFSSYVVGLQGQNHLQVATLQTREEFVITSEKKLLRYFSGGTVEVSAKVPCEISYIVPLKDAEWQFFVRDNGKRLIVIAPEISFNRPAVDLAKYELRVDKSSMIRDSEEVKTLLQGQIPAFLEEVGHKNITSIKDTARLAIKDFIENWLMTALNDGKVSQPVVDRVFFHDESELYRHFLSDANATNATNDLRQSERHN